MGEVDLKKLCSSATLQSQIEGFFNQWAEQVEESLPPDFFTSFANLDSDSKRIKRLWQQQLVHSLHIQGFSTAKNAKVAEDRRREGNKAFHENKIRKSLQFYSQAIIRSPEGSEDLAVAFANRSAVLFHLCNYKLCLQDIELALTNNYPKRIRYKVYARRGQCLAKLGQPEEAVTAFNRALEAVDYSDMEVPKRKGWKKEMDRFIQDPFLSVERMGPLEEEEAVPREPLFRGVSSILPKASDALTIKYSKNEGRYIAACEDIPAGKCLVREDPFCSVLMQEKRGAFCEHCFKSLLAPIPCKTCSGVAFCSPACRDESFATYHRWECPYLDLFKASGMSMNCFLSLRVITQRGIDFFKQAALQRPDLPSAAAPHAPNAYSSFFHLVALEEKRDVDDFLRRSLMAIFHLKVLQHAGFFEKVPCKVSDKPLTGDESLIVTCLLRHLQTIQFNAHEVSGIAYEGVKEIKRCKSTFIGLAVYPTVSFFNHSCYPAVGRYFDGKEMTIVNLRPLRRGENVPENYGPIFTHAPLQDRRRKLLSRYWFNCNCEACINDWPSYDTMPETILLQPHCSFLPQDEGEGAKKKGKRNKRRNRSSTDQASDPGKESSPQNSPLSLAQILKAHEEFDFGKTLMDESKREDAIAAYLRWVEAASYRVKLPLKDYHLALQALRLLVATRGTYYMIDPK